MKVIAKETLIMSGVIVNPGVIIDLDESTIEGIKDLVTPVPTKAEAKPPTGSKDKEPAKDPVADPATGAETKDQAAPESSTETKKEGK